jgi:cytoskeletal protein RodZ
MKKVGEVLAEYRQSKNIPLEKISQLTKIRVEFLHAIEANEFEKLPAAPFVKGFLHSYSTTLGLDPKTILALLRRDFKTGEKGQIIPRQYLKPLTRKRTVITPRLTAMASVGVIVSVIFMYAAIQWWQLRQPPSLEVENPLQDETVQKNVVVKGKTEIDAVLFVDSKPVAITPEGSFETTVFYSENGPHVITIRAEDRNKRATTIQRTINVEE